MRTSTDPNAAQWQAWDGEAGAFWAEHADRFDDGVAAYNPALLDAAAITPGATVLDVGCGTGHITRAVAGRAGHAHGIDLSARMLDLARRRAAACQVGNVSFTQADAQVHPFPPATIDVVISRHGSMFFDDPVAAFGNLGTALRPGGRLVLLVWQSFDRNPFMHRIRNALSAATPAVPPAADGRPGPISLADPQRVRAVLTAAGYRDIAVRSVRESMYLGPDPDAALDHLAAQHAALIAEHGPATRESALDRLRADVHAHHRPGRGVYYPSACWLITARTDDGQAAR